MSYTTPAILQVAETLDNLYEEHRGKFCIDCHDTPLANFKAEIDKTLLTHIPHLLEESLEAAGWQTLHKTLNNHPDDSFAMITEQLLLTHESGESFVLWANIMRWNDSWQILLMADEESPATERTIILDHDQSTGTEGLETAHTEAMQALWKEAHKHGIKTADMRGAW